MDCWAPRACMCVYPPFPAQYNFPSSAKGLATFQRERESIYTAHETTTHLARLTQTNGNSRPFPNGNHLPFDKLPWRYTRRSASLVRFFCLSPYPLLTPSSLCAVNNLSLSRTNEDRPIFIYICNVVFAYLHSSSP